MKQFLRFVVFILCIAAAGGVRAGNSAGPVPAQSSNPLGGVARLYESGYASGAAHLLVDPTRSRVYAVHAQYPYLTVIDSKTLDVVATVDTGATDPGDMAISADHSTLYIANRYEPAGAIAVLDLDTLQIKARLSLPAGADSVAAGLGNRLYVSAGSSLFNTTSAIYQIDATTGAQQGMMNTAYFGNDIIRLSSDRKMLYVGHTDSSGSASLTSYDASTATLLQLEENRYLEFYSQSETYSPLVVSNDGTLICWPFPRGNPIGGDPGSGPFVTAVLRGSDVLSYAGELHNGSAPGPLAFSPDGSLIYQSLAGSGIQTFDTQSYSLLNEFFVPAVGTNYYGQTVTDMAVDPTGSYLFLALDDDNPNTSRTLLMVMTTGTGTLTPASFPPYITNRYNNSEIDLQVGVPVSYQITALNSPTSYGAVGLPAGLSIDTTTGLISGTPTAANTNALYEAQVSATNATATESTAIYFDFPNTTPAPVINSTPTAGCSVGTPFGFQISATGAPDSFGATGLPMGLVLNATTGLITGTPTATGTFIIVLSAVNAGGAATATLTLTISASGFNIPVITSAGSGGGRRGAPFSYQITATNNPTSFTASGLPTGLTLNVSTGLLTGTPTVTGIFNITLAAIGAAGTGQTVLILTLTDPPTPTPVLTTPTATTIQIGSLYSYQIVASNAPTSYGATGLPPGLSVSSTTGEISGVPTAAGIYLIILSATNAGGTGQATLTLTVILPAAAPVITSATAASGHVAVIFNFQITASGGSVSFGANGLPDGLTLDAASGQITGTPAAAGTFAVTITATNAGGAATSILTLTIASDGPVVTLVATTPLVTAGTGDIGVFTLSLATAQDHDVFVNFTIRGSAVNGTDYVLIKARKKIKAGKTSKPIKIIPIGEGAGSGIRRVVTLVLQPGDGYTVGTTGKVKVKIIGH